ncbi:diguanylate cyclase [Mycolicibacterium fluoranthenivorans]|nr:diguanylate cyclase [Mycolicibacterium fluoranthenivorans]
MVGVLRSCRVFARGVATWWREPVDYPGQVQYFARRSLASAIRMLIGTGSGLMALIALAVLLPGAGRTSSSAHVALGLFVALASGWAVVWCTRAWPSQRMSRAFVLSADLGITMVALVGPTWSSGLFALNCFALVSAYLSFFDGAKALTLHTALILAATTSFITQLSVDDHLTRASLAATILGAALPTILTPLGIQLGICTLRRDANESVTDPLTGLLNRRGLHLHFAGLLIMNHSAAAALTVIVVDLDRFKDINDTYGHATGDEVLIRCARRIVATVDNGSALVARIGGEEFVVVHLADPYLADELPERIRHAIAASGEYPCVTASLGVANVAHEYLPAPDADPAVVLDDAIARADEAMFDAKRVGGNAIRQI